MAFDQSTRNRLQRFVNDARKALEEEFTRQLQNDYGLDPISGTVTALENLKHLNDTQRESSRILRDTLAHYCASQDADTKTGLERIVREQAFTVLNRLAALRMAEARGLMIESVGNGFQAKGFQLYVRLAGGGLGETGDAYRVYLFSVFDELAQDLPGLFDRYSPQGRLFPREAVLLQVLALINDAEIERLWAEDETLGWIYQYFNSKEERKAMRDASQAPRNSRELAVRNQFFTPRYVVEFLVDNTLGRFWFNATGGETGLRERCQYLLVKPDEKPTANIRLRDPRTIKLLDPACGSMHFGLYAFDLFLDIYREAWAWEQQHGPGSLDVSLIAMAELKPLSQTYSDEDAFLRDAPKLIIEYNIYGVDIDPRAAQIAALALWLRAQRAWHEAAIKAKDRPSIANSHVLAAVAPPAEKELRKQFATDLDKQDAELFEKTLQLLKRLPELGVLLKMERELPRLVREVYGENGPVFLENDKEQWQRGEERLRVALREFIQTAKSSYLGRLFVQDALQGLRIIDLSREIFDVIVMNPPFGAPTDDTYDVIRTQYSGFHNDIYASFVARACQLSPMGFIGCISSRSFLMSPRLERFRSDIVLPKLMCIADFGLGVMDDAHVESAAYVLGPEISTTFELIDLRKSSDSREVALTEAVKTKSQLFLQREWFLSLPQAKLLYAAPARVRELLSRETQFEPTIGTAREGMKSFDNFRFIRLWWEVDSVKIGKGLPWVRFSKGGAFSFFYLDTQLVLNWENDGAELKEVNRSLNGSTAQVRQASDYWYTAGNTYSKRSARGFSARALPKDVIFTSNGPAVLSTSDASPVYILGWLNSKLIRGFIHLQSNFGDYSTGSLKKLPWVQPGKDVVSQIESTSKSAVNATLASTAFTSETSPWFHSIKIEDCLSDTTATLQRFKDESVDHQEKAISLATTLLSEAYGIDNLTWADELLGTKDESSSDEDESGENDENSSEIPLLSQNVVASKIISYSVGCIFGRWDFEQYLLTEKAYLENKVAPCAFGVLPQTPPGSINSLLDSNVEKYPTILEPRGIETTSLDSRSGLVERVRTFIYIVLGGEDCSWERDICNAVNVSELDDYFYRVNGFFARHLMEYSVSGRQAPVYWPLATSSNSFILWIYYPSLTSQTLYTAINDYIDPKLKDVGDEVAKLANKGATRNREEENRFEALKGLELELMDLRETLLKIAQDYNPNHDDGVQISAAPLWPLFRHKPWQKVLKDTWAKLEKGEYDWAHLAMNYWPARVKEKCKTDKSLAIAHGLEELYQEPEAKPKKTRGKKTGV